MNHSRRTSAGAIIVSIALGLILSTGCDSATETTPSPGVLRVAVETAGLDRDTDGYVLSISDGRSVPVSLVDTVYVRDLAPGECTIRLEDVADQCTIHDGGSRVVTVEPAARPEISFGVVCPEAEWTVVPLDGTSTGPICGITFFGTEAGHAITCPSSNPVLFTTLNGGRGWKGKSVPTDEFYNTELFYFKDVATGFVGTSDGEHPVLLTTSDAGESWTARRFSEFRTTFESMAFADEESGWMGDPSGLLLRTTDGGESWQEQDVGYDQSIEGIAFTDANHGVFAGSHLDIYRTTDAGASWSPMQVEYVQYMTFTEVAFASDSVGVAVGLRGSIYRTSDAGATWHHIDAGVTDDLRHIAFGGDRFGVATGPRVVVATFDGGKTWLEQKPGSDIFVTGGAAFSGPRTAWVGSHGKLVRMTIPTELY